MTSLKKMIWIIGLAAVYMGGYARAIEAASNPSISSSTNTPSPIAYSPDKKKSEMCTTGTVQIKSNGYTGDFFIILTYKNTYSSRTNSGDALSYGFFTDQALSSTLDTTGTISDASAIKGTFPSTATSTTKIPLNYYLAISPDNLPTPTTYTLNLTLTLYVGSPTAYKKITSKSLTLKVSVPACTAAILNTEKQFDAGSLTGSLNLGTLPTSQSQSIYLLVRSNKKYDLAFSSRNGGSLVNEDDSSSSIPYALTCDTRTVTFTGAGVKNTAVSKASETYGETELNNVRIHTLGISIPTDTYPAFPSAGDYSDTITITVTARN